MSRARVSRLEAPRSEPPAEVRLPMRAVVRLTGLSADTVRAWERRHAAIVPARTEGRARRYTQAEVRRLTLLRDAVRRGHGIGELAQLGDEILSQLGRAEPTGAEAALAALRTEVLEAALRFDARAVELALARAAASLPVRVLALELLVPILHEVGDRWHAGALSIAHEHMVTQQVRALVDSLVRAHAVAPGAPRIVLAAPAGHLHDVGLLVAALFAAQRGLQPIVLGANLPLAELRGALGRLRAAVVVIAVARDLTAAEASAVPAEIASLAERHEVWLGVPPDHALARGAGRARALTSLEAFDTALVARFSTV